MWPLPCDSVLSRLKYHSYSSERQLIKNESRHNFITNPHQRSQRQPKLLPARSLTQQDIQSLHSLYWAHQIAHQHSRNQMAWSTRKASSQRLPARLQPHPLTPYCPLDFSRSCQLQAQLSIAQSNHSTALLRNRSRLTTSLVSSCAADQKLSLKQNQRATALHAYPHKQQNIRQKADDPAWTVFITTGKNRKSAL